MHKNLAARIKKYYGKNAKNIIKGKKNQEPYRGS
jgi:hypothetical protein